MKRKPDKYRTMKCPLKNIIIDQRNIEVLFEAMMRTHKLVIQSYQFLRFWILKKYKDNKTIPEITPKPGKKLMKAGIGTKTNHNASA